MAGGVYDQRISVHGTDEIAALAVSFNKMADAVSTHINAVTATAEEQKLLLAALTHELKTPMTSIIGYSETLMRTKLTKVQREEAVSYLHAECARLERLTQKMMRLITLSGGDEIALARLPVFDLGYGLPRRELPAQGDHLRDADLLGRHVRIAEVRVRGREAVRSELEARVVESARGANPLVCHCGLGFHGLETRIAGEGEGLELRKAHGAFRVCGI